MRARLASAVMSRRQMLLAASAASAFGIAGPAMARQAGAYPLDDFFVLETYVAAALSPSGAKVAMVRQQPEGDGRRTSLEILDAANPTGPRTGVPIGPHEVQSLEWASETRVVVRLIMRATAALRGSAATYMQPEVYEIQSRRVVSIDVNTGHSAMMFEGTGQRVRASLDLGWIVDMLHDEPDHVLMAAWEASGILALHRVNITTGQAQLVERGTRNTFGWYTQNGVAVIRRDVNGRGNVERVYARAPGESDWRFVRQVRIKDAPEFAWIAPTERPGVGLVMARLEGEDVESVRELDLRTLAFGPPISQRTARDVSFGLRDHRDHYLGAAYYQDRLEYDFAETQLAPHHRAMNQFFGGNCNVAIEDTSQDLNRILVSVDGPQEPGAWYLYDRAARHFEYLGSRRMLEGPRLGTAEVLRVPTRDGAEIEAILTRPASGAPGPLVVLAHGGPEVRDYYGWDRQAQVLAAQGWWVIQPNFRGSGGYGHAFAQAGWRRWGERMQEDIEDAVAFAIAQRGLPADKVAIMGTSYGGYAALMGAVRRPDLYKAAIGICGVYDLPDMLATERRDDDSSDQIIYRFWVDRIGDPTTDRAALEAASPRQRAAEIACPVLLVHGDQDYVVSVMQSTGMRDALNRAGKTVEYVPVVNGGHADWEDDAEARLQARYLRLLRSVFA